MANATKIIHITENDKQTRQMQARSWLKNRLKRLAHNTQRLSTSPSIAI
ncbi:MAG: hypothetical protein ACJAUL_001939, partial [Paraglaciecola sp.]